MNIAHIVASLDNAAAGPSYSVARLTKALSARGQTVELMCTTTGLVAEETARSGGKRLRLFSANLGGTFFGKLALSGGLRRAIDAAAANGAVLHSHGLWLMPNIYSAHSAKQHNSVHIISPRGMLGPDALQFSRRRKQLVWMLAQKKAVEVATCLHATSQHECDQIRELGLKVPVAVVPNGVDLPVLDFPVDEVVARREESARTLLYLGRLHPKKGVDRLVAAWKRIETKHPDWRLRIVGPSEHGHRRQLEAQVDSLGAQRVSFDDALFGAAKDAAYQGAELFVLPTLNENFGMVVAEALSHATPVICTRSAPWQGLEAHKCGWWIEQGVEPLTAALDEALMLPNHSLAEMGERGRSWMAASFTWESIAREMEQVYNWCVAGGEIPACVNVVR